MKRYAPIFFATLLWVWPGIFIKYLGDYFSSYTQNFYRFLAASLFLLAAGLVRSRRNFLSSFRNLKVFLPPAACVLIAQITWVEGIVLTEPAFASFLRRSSILFVILFSFMLFRPERMIISSKFFIMGTILCAGGIAGVILGGGAGGFDFGLGTILVLLSALFWAMFIVSIRRISAGTDSLLSSGVIFMLTLPVFLAGGAAKGDIMEILHVGRFTNFILFASGILFVGIANTLQYKSIKLIGSSLTANLVLSTPFLTAVASYYIFGEVLTALQIFSGTLLLAGAGLLTMTRAQPEL